MYMIDIETLSTDVDAIIATIACVEFKIKPYNFEEILKLNSIYLKIDLDSCRKIGLTENKETLNWWNEQNIEARNEIFDKKERIDISDALILLSNFIKNDEEIWINGLSFDIPILEFAMKKCNIKIPWKYWKLNDVRTIKNLIKYKRRLNIQMHNSLTDCRVQIFELCDSFYKIYYE